MQFPTEISHITPEWLTKELSGKLFPEEERVIEFTSKRIGEGEGFMSEIHRLNIKLSSQTEKTLIAKLPNAAGRSTGSQFGYFTTEVFFYNYYCLQSKRECPFKIPKCYFVAPNQMENIPILENGEPNVVDFCILMEDCHPTQIGDQIKGLSLPEMEKALINLAKFHAVWWKPSPDLLNDREIKPWISNKPILHSWAPVAGGFHSCFIQYIEKYLFPNGVDPIMKEVCEMLSFIFAKSQSAIEPLTVVHGDYRPDNMLFLRSDEQNKEGNGAEFYVIDFQAVHMGSPMEDVSYLLASGLPSPYLKENQERLLKVYYESLISANATIESDYSFERAKLEYREWLMYPLVYMIMTGGSLWKQLEKNSALALDRTRILMDGWTLRINESLILNDPRDLLPSIKLRHSSCAKENDEEGLDDKMNNVIDLMWK